MPEIVLQTSLAGGLGACYAPSGEREGQSPLACIELSVTQREARGAAPTRIPNQRIAQATGSARGSAHSHPRNVEKLGMITNNPAILSQIIGFDHYLVKPCAPADLLKLLSQLG